MAGRYVAFGVVAISLGACGSSTFGPPTAAAACSDYAAKVCERAQACEPGFVALIGYGTTADCVSAEAAICQRTLAEPHTGYTPARAQACGDALGAMTCAAFRSQATAPVCLPKGGTIANGGSCSDGSQCASGRCNVTDWTQCGTCVAQVPLGQACTATECADNLVCSASAPGVVNTVCTTPVGIGGHCNDDRVCPADARCDPTTSTCVKLPALGDPCDPSVVFFCDPATTPALCDSTTLRCAGPIVVVHPGAPCPSAPTTCAGGICSLDANSGAVTCVANVPSGGACAPTDNCAYGSNCVGGTCQPLICDGTPAAAGAAALVSASPWPSRRRGSFFDRSGRDHKLGRPSD
jgi:hypothetical protein